MPRKKKVPEQKTAEQKMPEKKMPQKVYHVHKSKGACGSGGAVYGVGFVGALVYYLSIAPTFWIGLFGVLKALLWPGFLVYELLRFLGA